jgi:hypothetical protein
MPIDEEEESILELFDISKSAQVGKVPLALIKFIPRIGEHIFLPVPPEKWQRYKVVNVEYFVGYDPSSGKPSVTAGTEKITLYVEESK